MGSLKLAWMLLLAAIFHVAFGNGMPGAPCDSSLYHPCTCASQMQGLYVDCVGVSGWDIQKVFQRATVHTLYSLRIILPPGCGYFPHSMLGNNTRATFLTIMADPNNNSPCDMVIDSGAFGPNLGYTNYLEMRGFGLKYLDLAFLKAFPTLERLYMSDHTDCGAIQTMPSGLTNLQWFSVRSCIGVDTVSDFPAGSSFTSSTAFTWSHGDLDDRSADVLVASMSHSFPALDFSNNRLTRMPPQLSYGNLKFLNLANNIIKVLKSESIRFENEAPSNIKLDGNTMSHIEPSAFIGDYRSVTLDLSKNALKTFPADVFSSILSEMTYGGSGQVHVESNPFQCDCGLAWLIRDQRPLLDRVVGGTCDNGTTFEQLNPNGFTSCYQK